MTIWSKGVQPDPRIIRFTAQRDRALDQGLACADIAGSLAHVHMLESIGLLTSEECIQLTGALRAMHQQAGKGAFVLPEDTEDIHSYVESELIRQLGDTGRRLHTGRSRNEQVLLDIRLYLREKIEEIATKTSALFHTLLHLAGKHKDDLMPGYTHMQLAMPSSFGLWFSAWAESLAEDLLFMQAAYCLNNRCPMGSGAGFGSSLPLNRELVATLLGFDGLTINSLCASLGRGKTEKATAVAMAAIAHTLSRLANDVCLYAGQNFGFLSFPESLCTGSSIMPHKKNPDGWEIIRARCNKMQALPQEISLIMANLPAGYHRDLQVTKEGLLPALQDLSECLDMADYMMGQVQVRQHILQDAAYDHLFSVEKANELVKQGMPFRTAYRQVAALIREGQYTADKQLQHTHTGSIGNLALDQIRARMESVMKGFSFERVNQCIKQLTTSTHG